MKNPISIIFLFLSIIICAWLSFSGIRWGIPSKERADMVLSQNMRTGEFYAQMEKSREDIYKHSNNSPLGRTENKEGSALSPILKSLGVTGNEILIYTGQANILSNFVRPYMIRTYHTDEQMTIASLSRMKPGQFDLDPRIYQYGGLYIYGMGAYFYALKSAGILKLSGNPAFYYANPDEIGKFFVAGRALNTVFMLLIIIAVYLLANRFYGPRTAALSALFTSVCPAFIFQTHIMKPYIGGTLFVIMSLYFAMKAFETEKIRHLMYGGLSAGLAAAMMPVYGIILCAPIISFFMLKKKTVPHIVYPLIMFAFTFLLVNPYWLINFKDVLAELTASSRFYATSSSGIMSLLGFMYDQGKISMTEVLFILAFIGSVYTMLKRERISFIPVFTGSIFFIFFTLLLRNNGISPHNTRFLLPAAAIFIIIAASSLEKLLRKNIAAIAVISLLALFLEFRASYVIASNFNIDSTAMSTRILAGNWVNANVKKGSYVGIVEMPEPSHVPPFVFSNYKIVVFRNNPFDTDVDYLIFERAIPDLFTNSAAFDKYALEKQFLPSDTFLAAKYPLSASHLNSSIYIFGRNSRK